MVDEDLLEFADAGPAALLRPGDTRRQPWRILVVDDDHDVHESTVYGLRGLDI